MQGSMAEMCLLMWTCFLQEEEPEKYQAHFASYVENDVEPDAIEDMYKEV